MNIALDGISDESLHNQPNFPEQQQCVVIQKPQRLLHVVINPPLKEILRGGVQLRRPQTLIYKYSRGQRIHEVLCRKTGESVLRPVITVTVVRFLETKLKLSGFCQTTTYKTILKTRYMYMDKTEYQDNVKHSCRRCGDKHISVYQVCIIGRQQSLVLKNSAGAQLQAWHITAPSRAPSITLC